MVSALGVVFDLNSLPSGCFHVCNTEKRIKEVCNLIDGILESKRLTLKEAQVARGRLAFCDAYVFGKAGRSALQAITSHGYARPFCADLSSRLVETLNKLKCRLLKSEPKMISYLFL